MQLTIGFIDNSVSIDDLPSQVVDSISGVGLIRGERIVKDYWLTQNEWHTACKSFVSSVCSAIPNQPVWYRTMDRPSDRINQLAGCDSVVHEPNSAFGLRGIRRSLKFKDVFARELKTIVELRQDHKNLHLLFPFMHTPSQFKEATELARSIGYDGEFGFMAEIPATLEIIDQFTRYGARHVVFGLNDLTDCFYGFSRTNDSTKVMRSHVDLSTLKKVLERCLCDKQDGVQYSLAVVIDEKTAELARDLAFDAVILTPAQATDLIEARKDPTNSGPYQGIKVDALSPKNRR